MKIKNNLVTGVTNSDINFRLLPNGTMVETENFFVTTSGGKDVGLGKNIMGNVLVANNQFLGGKSYGVGKDSANNKVYYFVKSTQYDYLMEYDVVTNANIVVLQSTTGTRLNLKAGERITNIDIFIDPEGNGNLIAWSGDSNPPRIGNIERMKTWGVDGFTAEELMVIKAPPTYSPVLTPIISIENPQANYLEDKFICFATRFKYKDGYYSAISSWSKYFFEPNSYELDFETFENHGMLNSFNSVDISFDTGEREVLAVDLLFKYSNGTNVYKVDSYIKEEEGWADKTTQKIEFNNSKVYGILPIDQYYRSFDNVPEMAIAQTPIGNRVGYANYKEGKNLIDKYGKKVVMDYDLKLKTKEISQTDLVTTEHPINYNYETPSVTVIKGQVNIDMGTTQFKSGHAIIFQFKLKSFNSPTITPTRLLEFTKEFKFNLYDDYVNLTDLITRSSIQSQLDTLTDYFQTNGGVSLPQDYLAPYVVLKGFKISNTVNVIHLTFPVIKYEIDETPDPNTFITDYFYDNFSQAKYYTISVATSLKSYRSYEIGMIYRDLQCRKTTVLTSAKNTLFIPNKNAITQNQIQVDIPTIQKPPVWAKTYKFALKINQGLFETIPINIFFVDGIYRWIKIDGENKNKIKDGDILIIKRDGIGFLEDPIKVKVLDLKEQPENFITTNGTSIFEPSGLYAKIRGLGFEMEYAQNEFTEYYGDDATEVGRPQVDINDFTDLDASGNKIDKPFPQGSTVTFSFSSNYHNESPFVLFNKVYTADQSYSNFEEFFVNQIQTGGFTSQTHPDRVYAVSLLRGSYVLSTGFPPGYIFNLDPNGFLHLFVTGTEAGTDVFAGKGRNGFVTVRVYIRRISNLYIFENTAKEVRNEIFYETPEIFDVIDGEHEMSSHLLTETYNCFSQGNGVESYQIRDAYNENYLSIDFSPTAVSEDEYRQVNRYADITYSGIYNSTTNVNALNEFNLYRANFKDDIEKNYGAVMKIRGKDTDLEVYQEDKVSIVYYGKDLLSNADGSTNLVSIEQVLGKQNTYQEENGISTHPESFDFEALNRYFTDVKNGTVCKLSNNGIFEITNQGQKNHFRKLFRNNTINSINGQYEQFNDFFILNIRYNDNKFETWVYSDKDDGWLGKISFNPDDMIRINSEFISFKNGNVYRGNQEKDGGLDNYNTFFGIQYPSKFSYVVNDEPSIRKNHKAISIESTDAWDIELETDLNKGYINKSDFSKEEGVFYGFIRSKNDTIDTSLIGAYQGIGNCTISGLVLNFAFDLEPEISIGDEIRNSNMQIVGTILSKTNNSLSLNSITNIINGDFVLCCKPQSIENNNLLGSAMLVSATLNTNKKTEVFALGCEVQISNPK